MTDEPSKPARPIDENLLRRLLSVVGDDAILVGGQSLAVVAHFGTDFHRADVAPSRATDTGVHRCDEPFFTNC